MSRTAIFFATGYEEIEALTVVDILRRAGEEITMVSVTDERSVTSSHGVEVTMDKVLSEVNFDETDVIVLPGGMPGTKNLEACAALMEQVDAFYQKGKYINSQHKTRCSREISLSLSIYLYKTQLEDNPRRLISYTKKCMVLHHWA